MANRREGPVVDLSGALVGTAVSVFRCTRARIENVISKVVHASLYCRSRADPVNCSTAGLISFCVLRLPLDEERFDPADSYAAKQIRVRRSPEDS